MHYIISFKSDKFDITQEDENPINPIFGQSLLKWLKTHLSDDFEISEPDAEDWGWYSILKWENRDYLIGSSVCFEEGDNPNSKLEWVFQVDKHRSLKEKLFGREKMTREDECLMFFKKLFESESSFESISVQ